ncbi:MAG: hypothetical protein WD402_10615 [Chloroflexota bacterium]
MNEQIRDYIQENRQKYTREAIRDQLIAAGHDAAQIDGAWALEMASPASQSGDGLSMLARALFVLGMLVGAFGALALTTSSYVGSVSALIFLPGYAVSYVAVGYGIVRLLRWAEAAFRIPAILGVLIGLALLPIYGGGDVRDMRRRLRAWPFGLSDACPPTFAIRRDLT